MSEFDVPLGGVRLAEVLHGDTLQQIAARELGDAARWVDLANLNGLVPPYITDDPAEVGPGVLKPGGVILLPAPAEAPGTGAGTADDLYQRDVDLSGGELSVGPDGDLAIVAGEANLRQALVHRVVTEQGELLFHPNYGSMVRAVLGAVAGPTAAILAARYAAAALRADARVRDVRDARAEVRGDVVRVEALVQPVTNRSTKIEATL